jgi:2-keto-4-pentenoate hydratase
MQTVHVAGGIAATLLAAERDRTETAQLAERFPDLDLATAYRVQQAFVQSKIGVHRMIK